jgi:hypothetical protein
MKYGCDWHHHAGAINTRLIIGRHARFSNTADEGSCVLTSSQIDESNVMTEANTRGPRADKVEDARDLLVKLYGEIRISALAAALEMSRRPAPEELAKDVIRDVPAILGDHDLAA